MFPGFDVGDDENIGLARDRRDNALRLRGLLRNGVVESERSGDDATNDLPPIGHLAQCRDVERRSEFRGHGFHGR